MKKEHRIILAVSIFYAVYILLFLAKFDFNPSATIEFAEKYVNGRALPSGLVIQVNSEGQDGRRYYMRVLDIFHREMSGGAYWHQRPLYPWLACLVTFGNISLIPWALLLVNFAAVILGTYIFILIVGHYKTDLDITYLFAFNVGFLVTVIRDLAEPLLVLFLLLFILHFERKQYKLSSLFLACAVLTKEIALLVICPLVLYFLIKRELSKTIVYLFPLVVFLVWQIILSLKSGIPPFLKGVSWMSFPLLGVVDYIKFLTNFIVVSVPTPGLETFKWLVRYCLNLWPLFFAVIQIYVMFKSKPRIISAYAVILLAWIFFVFCMGAENHFTRFDELARFLIPLFMFSMLYSVERKEKYNFALGLILFLTSVFWFIERILFKVQYFVT